MLGKRAWPDFARDINTAFAVLEDLAESFEPSPRRSFSLDQDTIRAELDARESDLTDQERRILTKVAAGASNKDIATELNLSERTVKNYLSIIFQKLQVNNRTEAAIRAMRDGLVDN